MRQIITIITLLIFSGCQQQLKDAKNKAQIPNNISKTIQDYVSDPSKSVEELEKLSQIEYKVFSIDAQSSNSKLEQTLNEMGSRRWDCFQAENRRTINESGQAESKILFFCKRMPETLLRYIPRSLIGR